MYLLALSNDPIFNTSAKLYFYTCFFEHFLSLFKVNGNTTIIGTHTTVVAESFTTYSFFRPFLFLSSALTL